jgi:hypothetical protein
MQRKKLFKKKKIKILDARLLYKNTKCFAANKTPLNWMWIHNIRPWNSPSNELIYVGTLNILQRHSLQQKVSLYTKRFHWILSEFTCLMNMV